VSFRQIILDTETTGLDPLSGHRIIEIGAIEVENKVKTGRVFHYYINPDRDVPNEAFKIHGISTNFLRDKPKFKDIAGIFLDFIGKDSQFIIHNAMFDMKFLNHELQTVGLPTISFDRALDTLLLARKKFPGSPATLDALCKRFNISLKDRESSGHGALLDSELLYKVYICLTEGIQSDLFNSGRQESGITSKKSIKRDKTIEARSFSYPEDFKKYKEFIDKIKNNLWENV
jgi:DNA polymerase-3 subunit epsilon